MADNQKDKIEVIPPQKATPKNKTERTVMMKAHSGPLPAPEDFAAYEKVHKGAADRIIKMAESALKAEIKMGYMAAITQFVSMFMGKFFVYALGGAAVFLLVNGYEIAALLTGLGPIAQAIANGVDTFKKKSEKLKEPKDEQKEVPETN